LGEHDFSNFSSEKLFKKVSQKREIKLIKCFKRNGIVTIRVISKGFMRYQIRAMIGEAINCYEGKIEAKEIKERLDDGSSKKNKYKKIAPPFGLYLWKISYY
jgi:tRNA pseudouridine38-40 synthase